MGNFSDYVRRSRPDDNYDEEQEGFDEADSQRVSWWHKLRFWGRGEVVSFPGAKRGGVYLLIVTSLHDAQKAADLIKGGVAVVANLQNIDRRQAQRIVDVLSGVCYALDGTFIRFGERLFLFAPPTVPASGDERCMREINQLFIGGIADGAEPNQTRSQMQGRLLSNEHHGDGLKGETRA
ncbi:MAG: cell division protein SepF [Armatimonadota bacterium]|nr:cell division protein SepF [Armatimonadota bacterium]MDW8025604.1 cell division protein SepF [Armatimonadota bacterium]